MAGWLGGAASASAQNIVINGDFASGTLAGWSYNGSVVPSGQEAIIGSPGNLWQTLTTTEGGSYNFSFTAFSTDQVPGIDPDMTFKVLWDGTEISSRNVTGADGNLGLSFTGLIASTTNTQVYFQSIFGNFVQIHLDNVVVTAAAVPEPATYAEFAGVLALGACLFSRRKNAA